MSRRDIYVTTCKIVLLLSCIFSSYVWLRDYLVLILKFYTVPVRLHDIKSFLNEKALSSKQLWQFFLMLRYNVISQLRHSYAKGPFCPPLSRKRGDIKSHSSVCPSVRLSVCHKNFNLGHNFCTTTDRALILGMCVPCDKTFPMVPCRDLDSDLWPTSRSNLLPSGGTQFSEFACCLTQLI